MVIQGFKLYRDELTPCKMHKSCIVLAVLVTYESFDVEAENVALWVLGIGA